MQLALSLLMAAMSLLTTVRSTPNVSPELRNQAVTLAQTAITYAQSLLVVSPIVYTSLPATVEGSPIVGSVVPIVQFNQPINQSITMPQEITCTLTAEANSMPPSSMVKLTWTSNADGLSVKNNRVYDMFEMVNPVDSGTKEFLMSSESGENNTFTARFSLNGQTKDCTVSVMTE